MSKLVLLALGLPGVALLFTAAAAEGAELPSLGTLILPAIIIIVLVLLNGLFVAAEFALIGSRPSRLEQMSDEGSALAGRMLAMRTETALQDRYIATAQALCLRFIVPWLLLFNCGTSGSRQGRKK